MFTCSKPCSKPCFMLCSSHPTVASLPPTQCLILDHKFCMRDYACPVSMCSLKIFFPQILPLDKTSQAELSSSPQPKHTCLPTSVSCFHCFVKVTTCQVGWHALPVLHHHFQFHNATSDFHHFRLLSSI